MPESCSPAANYLTRSNIVVPVTTVAAQITALQVAARAEIAERLGVTSVTGGSITKAAN